MKRTIKKELKEMYHLIPPKCDDREMNAMIEKARKKDFTFHNNASLFWLIKSQARFVEKKTWWLQLILILFYGICISVLLETKQGFLLLVPAAPLMVLLSTGELSRSFRYRMVELEFPTRFSLRELLVARLCLVAISDLITFTCLLIFTSWKISIPIGYLILYGIVPYILAAFGSLFIMNRYRGASVRYYTAAYCLFLTFIGTLSLAQWPGWYEASAQVVWILLFLAGLAGICVEVHRLWFNCSAKQEF